MNCIMRFRKNTGWIFFIATIFLWVIFLILNFLFDMPEMAYKDTETIFVKFNLKENTLVKLWYLWTIPSVMMIMGVIMLDKVLKNEYIPLRKVIVTFGIISWIIQLIGVFRWVYVVPYLSDKYILVDTTDSLKGIIDMIWQSVNQYGGFALGQSLGLIFLSLWLLFISIPVMKSPLFKRWLGWLAIVIALGLLIGSLSGFYYVFNFSEDQLKEYLNIFSIFWTIYMIWQIAIAWRMMNNEDYESSQS